jgi:hypothetical protein
MEYYRLAYDPNQLPNQRLRNFLGQAALGPLVELSERVIDAFQGVCGTPVSFGFVVVDQSCEGLWRARTAPAAQKRSALAATDIMAAVLVRYGVENGPR